MEEERSKGHPGLRVSLQLTKGILDYATLPIGAETTPTEGSWWRLTTLPIRSDTSEPHGNDRLSACHRAAMA